MREIKRYINLIDRISKVLDLPIVRDFTRGKYNAKTNTQAQYLIDLGFTERYYYSTIESDYLYLEEDYCKLGAWGINSTKYTNALNIISNIDNKDYTSMSDEELKLLLRLN